MINYLWINFLVGLGYSVFRLKMLNFNTFIWMIMNIFTTPIVILGEFWADYRINCNAKKMGINTKEYGYNKSGLYFFLFSAYLGILYMWFSYTFKYEPNIFIFVVILVIYYFFNIGTFFYKIARVKFWWLICLVSYFIAAIIYYETPIKNDFENKTLYKKEESNFIDKISIDEKKEIKNILVNTALEMNNISNSSIPIKEKIKILTDYDITYHSKINNSNLKSKTKKILINQKEVFNSMKEMNFAIAYINEAFNTLDSSYIDLAADYYKKYSFGKLDSELEEFIKIAKFSIEDIKLNRFTEEKYQQLSDSYKRIQNKAYELSDRVWD